MNEQHIISLVIEMNCSEFNKYLIINKKTQLKLVSELCGPRVNETCI